MTEELRKLAEAADGGHWYDDADLYTAIRGEHGVISEDCDRDASFISAASPAAVLAMLDRIAELEDNLASEVRRHDATGMANVGLMREADEARAAVKRLAGDGGGFRPSPFTCVKVFTLTAVVKKSLITQ